MQAPELIAAYFDGTITPEQFAELGDWLNESADHGVYFAQWSTLEDQLDEHFTGHHHGSESESLVTMIAAIDAERRTYDQHASGDKPSRDSLKIDGLSDPSPKPERVIVIPRVAVWGAIAAIVLLGVLLIVPLLPSTPPTALPPTAAVPAPPESTPTTPTLQVARLESANQCVWEMDKAPSVGDTLEQRTYQLEEGQATIRFHGGGVIHIESPARFSLDSIQSMTLASGRLVGYCDADASGFAVRTPDAQLVDLGTEFGVWVQENEQTQLHVFVGQVRASLLNQLGQVVATRVVSESQAVSARPDSADLTALDQADSELFEATRQIDLPVWSTGEEVRQDDGVDPNWQIIAVNGEALDTPVSAVRYDPPQSNRRAFRANVEGQLTWITDDPEAGIANQDRYTYATQFNLDETVDLESLRLEIRFLADNYVIAIRLNGQAIDTPEPQSYERYDTLTQALASEGFVQGINHLEIDVSNLLPDQQVQPTLREGEINPQSLMVELALQGLRRWKTTGEQATPTP